MSKKNKPKKLSGSKKIAKMKAKPVADSLLDVMQDNLEFESLLSYDYENLNLKEEIKKSIAELEAVREHPVICYVANIMDSGGNNSIDLSDDLPFKEMVTTIPVDEKEIDIVLITPGGLAAQVNNFVNVLRPRFDKVTFVLLDMAMSAGTILIMSGDDIIMSADSKFGPIDPQIPNKEGRFVPAQSILLAIRDIQERGQKKIDAGQQPDWTDITILNSINHHDIGSAIGASNYSIQMVKNYLVKYKFRQWTSHTRSGAPVTSDEKEQRAEEIANLLCNHSVWKNHGHAINRIAAWSECKLKITHSETISGLDRVMRRMRALFYWIFVNTIIEKIFISKDYCIIISK